MFYLGTRQHGRATRRAARPSSLTMLSSAHRQRRLCCLLCFLADRLARSGKKLVELDGLYCRDLRVDQRRQFVLRQDDDARLALVELDRARAVEDREDDLAIRPA